MTDILRSPSDARGQSRARSLRAMLVAGLAIALMGTLFAARASASACSTSTGASSCAVTANLTYTAGTLGVASAPSLYWSMIDTGYDQWASASSGALSGCSTSSGGTHCTGGSWPLLEVLDATGSGSGWALSEYLSSDSLPSGTVLKFQGAGTSTPGYSTASAASTDPFAATVPSTVCDYASTCTTATAATSCSHAGLGFSSCPATPVTMGGTSATSQVDLYSASASTGMGAICFGSGTASATGCTGTSSSAFYNLGLPSNASSGSSTATINLAVSSGP
jgi:hypothetical protein